jgi:hypothetical protein
VLPRSGGPAGNTLLTAWTALVLLVLSVGELLTLFDVRGLISWHVALGALLVPPAAMKTASTTWRMASYYLGRTLGEERAHRALLAALGIRVDWVTAHQAFFAVWAAAAGLHLLGRIVPALRATLVPGPRNGQPVPGRWARGLYFVVMMAAAAALAVLLVRADSSWALHGFGDRPTSGPGGPGPH